MAKNHKSLKGQLLLDGGNLRGSSFHRTVVIICQHDPKGAFGLVLNRPTATRVGDAIAGDLSDLLRDQLIYGGGPVQPQALSYLWSDPTMTDGTVIPNVSLGHSLEQLIRLAADGFLTRKLLVFAGYAGWTAGQLDEEMRQNAWVQHPSSAEWIFHADPAQIWRRIISRKGWQYKLMAEGPDDPCCN